MTPTPHAVRLRFVITDQDGLHLRAADRFVRMANQFEAEVWIHHEGRPINAKSILDRTTLAAVCGAHLELEARGADADSAARALAYLEAVTRAVT